MSEQYNEQQPFFEYQTYSCLISGVPVFIRKQVVNKYTYNNRAWASRVPWQQRPNNVLGCVNRSIAGWLMEVIVPSRHPIYSRLHLEYHIITSSFAAPAPIQERHWQTGVSLVEDHQNGEVWSTGAGSALGRGSFGGDLTAAPPGPARHLWEGQ